MNFPLADIKTEFPAVKKAVVSSCFSPRVVRFYDAVSNKYDYMNVPCGTCIHCQSVRQNDWVTRMQMQSLTSHYTYFVTLTFAPEKLLESSLLFEQTCCIMHKGKALPLLLTKKPLQDFIKRLRINIDRSLTPHPIKYFACGEYGDAFSRPHYHLLLWSDVPILPDLIVKSWKYGRVETDDLRANGTLDSLFNTVTENQFDEKNSAQKCFRYVAKYCTKQNKNMNNLFTLPLIRKYYEDVKNNQSLKKQSVNYETFETFIESYKPFIVCSTKSPIGIECIMSNVDKWTTEVQNKIECDTHIFQTPKIARRKFKEKLYSYRILSTANGRATCVGSPLALCRQIFDCFGDLVNRDSSACLGDEVFISNPRNECLLYDKINKHYLYLSSMSQCVEVYKYSRKLAKEVRAFEWLYGGSAIAPYDRIAVYSPEEFLDQYSARLSSFMRFLVQQQNSVQISSDDSALSIQLFKEFNNMSDDDFNIMVKSIRKDFIKNCEDSTVKYLARKKFRHSQFNKLL